MGIKRLLLTRIFRLKRARYDGDLRAIVGIDKNNMIRVIPYGKVMGENADFDNEELEVEVTDDMIDVTKRRL